jgi:hypothetical protein
VSSFGLLRTCWERAPEAYHEPAELAFLVPSRAPVDG